MKKFILLTLLAAVLSSCGASKVVQESEKAIKGNWFLDSVSYSESGTFNVNLLNDASATCFEGSNWHFVSNNNTGTYSINKSECPSGERYFVFTIQEVDKVTGLYDFLLKPTDEKNKSEFNRGFRMQLTQMTDSSMQWEQTVTLEGKPFNIYMNFSKVVE